MSEDITPEQMQQIITDVAAKHPNVQVVMPGQQPEVEALFGSIFAGVHMIAAVGEAARDCVQALPEAHPSDIAVMMLAGGDLLAGWTELDDRARTELMCVFAAAAVEAKVPAASLAGDQLAQTYAGDLLELGYETASAGLPLIGDPLDRQNTPLWCYAVSTVCDSSDPEPAKVGAVCLLAAAATKAEAKATREPTR